MARFFYVSWSLKDLWLSFLGFLKFSKQFCWSSWHGPLKAKLHLAWISLALIPYTVWGFRGDLLHLLGSWNFRNNRADPVDTGLQNAKLSPAILTINYFHCGKQSIPTPLMKHDSHCDLFGWSFLEAAMPLGQHLSLVNSGVVKYHLLQLGLEFRSDARGETSSISS